MCDSAIFYYSDSTFFYYSDLDIFDISSGYSDSAIFTTVTQSLLQSSVFL
jgi:hypothetical protein